LPLGWLWVIPAFHLPESTDKIPRTHRLTFTRSQIDFPLGPGQALHRVIVEIDELDEADRRDAARLMTSEEEERTGYEDTRGEKVKEEGE
jgi:phosphatidylinositol-3,4,5-trisphosphate 3-phosphatase/dual-specificity protein phosphatase PTEN